jgi:hypothetical protein
VLVSGDLTRLCAVGSFVLSGICGIIAWHIGSYVAMTWAQ